MLNASAALRYASVELGVDAYNVLGLRYADDEQVYVSNWSVNRGTAAGLGGHAPRGGPAADACSGPSPSTSEAFHELLAGMCIGGGQGIATILERV